jgi:nucleotide-binding universal stress UspA family protein
MFKHIVVPMDLSGRNRRAMRMARQLAQQSEARVSLIHVVQSIENIPRNELRTFYETMEKEARKKLVSVARTLQGRAVDMHVEVRIGNPPREIVDYAEESRADLIVMMSHRVSKVQGFSTTSYKVGILCRCPVLLVK